MTAVPKRAWGVSSAAGHSVAYTFVPRGGKTTEEKVETNYEHAPVSHVEKKYVAT